MAGSESDQRPACLLGPAPQRCLCTEVAPPVGRPPGKGRVRQTPGWELRASFWGSLWLKDSPVASPKLPETCVGPRLSSAPLTWLGPRVVSLCSRLLGLPPRVLHRCCSPERTSAGVRGAEGRPHAAGTERARGQGRRRDRSRRGFQTVARSLGPVGVRQRAINSCGAWWQCGLSDVWGRPLQRPDENERCVVGGRASVEEKAKAGVGPL